MIDPEDRILDLALEEMHRPENDGGDPERIRAALGALERRLQLEGSHRRSVTAGMKAAAVAASILSLSLASWFVLGRFGREREIRPGAGQAPLSCGKIQGVEVAKDGSTFDPGTGQNVSIDQGTAQGVRPESRFEVLRGSEVLGELVITRAEKTWSMGTYRPRHPRGEAARVGDAVHPLVPTAAGPRERQDQDAESELLKLFERLTDSDAAARDRASAALKEKGPSILDRLREELGRTKDAEARARLQDLIDYWTRGVAARVGDYVVMWEEVDAAFKGMRPEDITPELRRSSLLAVVEERAFLNEARRRGIVATETELAELSRRNAATYGGQEAYQAALRARGTSPEAEREALRRQLLVSKLYDGIMEEARAHPGADPFRLDLKETPREDLRRWYDANPEKFAGVDRVDVCWVELPFANEAQKEGKKALADAIVAKSQKKNLGLVCAEAGVQENIHIGAFQRSRSSGGPFSEATKKLLFDSFGFGEVRIIEDGSCLFVIQLYDRTRHVSETFEQAEPALRAMFGNQRTENNRKLMRDGILERARITPPDLFKNP